MKKLIVIVVALASQFSHASKEDSQITICGTSLNYTQVREMFVDGETPIKMVKNLLGEAKANAKISKACVMENGSLALVLVGQDNQVEARIITAP